MMKIIKIAKIPARPEALAFEQNPPAGWIVVAVQGCLVDGLLSERKRDLLNGGSLASEKGKKELIKL